MPVPCASVCTPVCASARPRTSRCDHGPVEFRSGALDFVVRSADGAAIQHTDEYFAVSGHAGFILGMGSQTWDSDVALIEEIARRFELMGQGSRGRPRSPHLGDDSTGMTEDSRVTALRGRDGRTRVTRRTLYEALEHVGR